MNRPAKTVQLRAARAAPPQSDFTSEHESTLIGLVDPFSPEAAQARYPDSGSGKSLTITQKLTAIATTDGGGGVAFAFNPKSSYPYIKSTAVASNVATWSSFWLGDLSTNLLNTYAERWRPTSMGVRIANTLSATTSAGYLVIAKGSAPLVSGTTTFDPSNFTSYDLHPLKHGGEWHAVILPRGSSAYDFQTISGGLTTGGDVTTWETLYVAVLGGPLSTASLIFEVFINYEYTPMEDAPIAALAFPQPVLNVQMQTAVNQVQSNHPTSHSGTKAAVKGFVKKEAKKALLKHVIPFLAKKGTQLLL